MEGHSMEYKNSFLSRLFGTKPEEAAKQTLSAPIPPEEPAPPPPPGTPLCHRLELPREHTLFQLRDIYTEQSGRQITPDLTLEGPGDPAMPDEAAKEELLRLKMLVTASANKRIELLRSQMAEEGGETSSLPDLNAQVNVFLSKDCLSAWLLIYPPVGGGKEVKWAALDMALAGQEIRFGINEELLNAIPKDPERYFKLFPVARGIPASHGTDGRVVDIFPRAEERKLTVDENNQADYSDLNFIHSVERGGAVCRIIPPTEGIPGRTVQGREIPAENGRPAAVPKGRNTALSEDGRALVATIAGHVEFSGRSFQVKPVLEIPGNVDFTVGDINFLGDVCIHGDICSGFNVRAMGTITVDGVVEACTVEAGRDLIVAKGVQGSGQAVIRAQRSIFAKQLESCCVYAKMDLETECIINCEVYCGGAVVVRTGHQSIIGGKVHAAREVSAGVMGSRAGNRTEIVLGGQPCEEFDYDLLTKDIQELEQIMEELERQPASPGKMSQMAKLRMQLTLNRGRLEEIDKEKLQQGMEPQEPGTWQMTCDVVFPETVLTINGVTHYFDDRVSSCAATLKGDGIQLK